MKVIEKSPLELVPYEKNPRRNEHAVKAVAASIREFGFKVPIIIDKDNVIVAGHTRLKAAKFLGLAKVPCVIADDLTDKQIKAFRLADNKTAELAEWDDELLKAELEDIDLDMTQFGFDDPLAEPVDDNYDFSRDVPSRIKKGEVFALGRHRLMCGDSAKKEDVDYLMDGVEVELLFTDPPYGVDYMNKPGLRHIKNGMKMMNDKMSDEDYKAFLTTCFANAREHMRPGAGFYVWHANLASHLVQPAVEKAGLRVHYVLIWVKNHFTTGWDYRWQHEPALVGEKEAPETLELPPETAEPCLYGWVSKGRHYFGGGHTCSTVIYENALQKNDLHPTMKPVPLCGRLIRNSTRTGENVLDVFGGSGSTLIAAEQLGRNAFVMELDPHYADVIIDRYEQYTGKKAVLVKKSRVSYDDMCKDELGEKLQSE